MSGSLFSSSWYKVAGLKVRLRKHAKIHRHVYRDKVWYVLQDHATGKFQRFSPQAYQIIGMLDGKKTLQQIWDGACQSLGDELPSQDEVISLISQLNRANVIQTDALPDIEQLQRRRLQESRSKILQQLKSPLSIRIPMLDPETFLAGTMWIGRGIFSKAGAFIWMLSIVIGVMLAVINWSALTENMTDRLLAMENILLIALVYPFVKVFHELGHAYAVKRWGGEVHEMGVMLLVLFPVPYVDASAATAFRNKYQRMVVGAVGIMAELMLSAVAMIVWVMVEPGIVRALAFNVMLIGGFSTLLFNGNPLLRFDAYYVLADYLEIPNLGSRGNNQFGYLCKRYLFKVAGVKPLAQSKSESFWLVAYAATAYVYRLFVMVAISLFVASQYFFVGVLLACWSVWSSLILPVIKMMAKPMSDPQLRPRRKRILLVSGAMVAALVWLLMFLPVAYKTSTEGVLYVPQQAYIRASVSGFVTQMSIENGDSVVPGQQLLSMSAPDLMAQAAVIKAQLLEAQARYQGSIGDRSGADILLQELNFIAEEYRRLEERMAGLTVLSRVAGEFVAVTREELQGRFFQRGELLGYVIDYATLPLAVMISEDNIDRVRQQSRSIELRVASQPNISYPGRIIRQLPSSTKLLPSATLSTEGGGKIILDPKREQQLQSYQSYFRLELAAPKAIKKRFDERVYVLIEHDPEPIFWRWYRATRRVFLRQFDV